MTIRTKILINFSVTTIVLLAISFFVIYLLFAGYREEAFQQKQKLKIESTIKLINRFSRESEKISSILDAQDIHDFFDEKLLVFDKDKQLIFSSLDNLPIYQKAEVLNRLSPSMRWVEMKEEDYDLIGMYIEKDYRSFYAISKAYDELGYNKLHFLRNVLAVSFALSCLIIGAVSFYLSANLSKPIHRLIRVLENFNVQHSQHHNIECRTNTSEIKYLTNRFNELLTATREAFLFQKHTTNLISHELKTPVAVLVSDMEAAYRNASDEQTRQQLLLLTEKAKSFGDIISSLLEIARLDSGASDYVVKTVRIDELIFDLIEKNSVVNPNFSFDIRLLPDDIREHEMTVSGSPVLLKQAFHNLISNAVLYSDSNSGSIRIEAISTTKLAVTIANTGGGISKEELPLLFTYFFRGKNSASKPGSGLGLLLSKKIFHISNADLRYSYVDGQNTFEVIFKKMVK